MIKFYIHFGLILFLSTSYCCTLEKNTPASTTKVCIIVPAYNEERRIQPTLEAYIDYFNNQKDFTTTFVVVANNCNDQTVVICKCLQKKYKNIELLDLKPGGKGFAVKQGFLHALEKPYDYIGFVDADLATLPQYYHDLLLALPGTDGVIASRYIKGACVWPKRPALLKWGGKLYNWLLRRQLSLPFKDTQCGAKIFTYDTIQKIAPAMTEQKWAFDLELLYLAKLEDKYIKEVPTTWSDQPGSHIVISTSLAKEFLTSPQRIKNRHKQKALEKKAAHKAAKRAAKKLGSVNKII